MTWKRTGSEEGDWLAYPGTSGGIGEACGLHEAKRGMGQKFCPLFLAGRQGWPNGGHAGGRGHQILGMVISLLRGQQHGEVWDGRQPFTTTNFGLHSSHYFYTITKPGAMPLNPTLTPPKHPL